MPSSQRSTGSAPSCSRTTQWGRCQQPPSTSSGDGLCTFHEQWAAIEAAQPAPAPGRRRVGSGSWFATASRPDPYYERKVVLGLTEPVADYLSETEAQAVLNGRYRGDGRRIDQYVSHDPLGIELPSLH